MKKLIEPKDFLFLIMLVAILSVAMAGFIQSTNFKSKDSQNLTSEIERNQELRK
jgi:hypothetical protein